MPFRVAVVGTGFIGPVHVEGLRRAGQEVVGILGSSAEKSKQAADRLRIPTAYADFDALLADGDVDSVHITSPNRYHFDQAAAALKAGKHVMCEKPLAMTSEESGKLVEIAAESGKAAGVNYNIRYYPMCLDAAGRVASGELGGVFHVAGSYVQDWMFHPTDFNWRVLASEGGELRAVADIGTHWLDLIYSITRLDVAAVCADLHTVYPTRQRPTGNVETFSSGAGGDIPTEPIAIDTEDYGCVMLRFANGARGVLWVSQVTAGRKNCLRFEIAGEKESLAWVSESPNDLWVGHRDRPNEAVIRDPGSLAESAQGFSDYPAGHNEGFPDTFKMCFRAFYNSIESGGQPNYPTFAEGHREIVLCEAILESHQEQRWIELNTK
ncbi:Gfo/Idh/MocA family protein [Stratiformator vulcanicus]|uniref:1,5-anhydro-D-fructose reductase n=1 Tax=Stratiformator vulcanicus TaxID=2527980 RepID=A0A517QYG0_9PLAN|nr:Gfo/Idh/MocA family oxidoreductase [Stratiformator vulcanicus]QDT36628.1 1,5-anhydro-D-fructose reductase [Stratiformator vulcanicus]